MANDTATMSVESVGAEGACVCITLANGALIYGTVPADGSFVPAPLDDDEAHKAVARLLNLSQPQDNVLPTWVRDGLRLVAEDFAAAMTPGLTWTFVKGI